MQKQREKLLREQEKCNLLGPVAATFTSEIRTSGCEFCHLCKVPNLCAILSSRNYCGG